MQLGERIDWEWIDREIVLLYSDKGRPGVPLCDRAVAPQDIYSLSDEAVCERRVCNRPMRLSITHNFCSDHGAQRDIGEA